VLNAVLRRQYFPPASKHARVISALKTGKDPTLLSSYRPINLLDTVGKLFDKILFTWVLREVNERGLLHDKQFGFRPRLTTTLQPARIVERVHRNFDERKLTGAVFCMWLKPSTPISQRPPLQDYYPKLPCCLVKTVPSYLHCRTFQTSFQSATSTRCSIRAGVAQSELVLPVLLSLYVNGMPTSVCHVEQPLCG
jgi:hypothetical protein